MEEKNSFKKHVGVVARMSRSNMYRNILSLLLEGAIGLDDLDGFSDDLRETMAAFMHEK